jgi:hypothetical protein
MAATSTSNLLQLVAQIKQHTENIEKQLQLSGYPELTFETNFVERPDNPDYAAARASLNDAANDLLMLVNGPKAYFRSLFCYQHDLAAFQIAFDYDFFNNIPLDGELTIPELAERVRFDEDRVARVLRFLTTHRVFVEKDGAFAHTAYSAIFAKDPEIYAAAHYQ